MRPGSLPCRWLRKVLADRGKNPGHREPDDILHRSLNPLDQSSAILLGGVGTRLVQGIDLGQIVGDHRGIEAPERDPGALHETASGGDPSPDQANAGQDLVDPPPEAPEHLGGVRQIAGFAEDLAVEHDDGVGTEHEVA